VSNKGITQFYLQSTHELYVYTLAARHTALWLILIVPTHEGMARLS